MRKNDSILDKKSNLSCSLMYDALGIGHFSENNVKRGIKSIIREYVEKIENDNKRYLENKTKIELKMIGEMLEVFYTLLSVEKMHVKKKVYPETKKEDPFFQFMDALEDVNSHPDLLKPVCILNGHLGFAQDAQRIRSYFDAAQEKWHESTGNSTRK